MKKILAVLFLFILTHAVFSMELDFFWDIGDVFVDGNLVLKEKINNTIDAGARVGELVLNDNDSGFALHINPFYWNCVIHYTPEEKVENRFSFLNLELFYDLLHFDNNNMTVGPYISTNYLDLVNMDFSKYQVDLGFKFTYFWKDLYIYYFKPETLTIRSGVRIRDNEPSIFIEGSVNLGGLIMGFINDSYDKAKIIKENY